MIGRERAGSTSNPVDERLQDPTVQARLVEQLQAVDALHQAREAQGDLVCRGPRAVTASGVLFQMSSVLRGPRHGYNPTAQDRVALAQPPEVLVFGGVLGEAMQQLHVGHVQSHLGEHTAFAAAQPSEELSGVEAMRQAYGAIRTRLPVEQSLRNGAYIMLNLLHHPMHMEPTAGTERLEPLAQACERVGLVLPEEIGYNNPHE